MKPEIQIVLSVRILTGSQKPVIRGGAYENAQNHEVMRFIRNWGHVPLYFAGLNCTTKGFSVKFSCLILPKVVGWGNAH